MRESSFRTLQLLLFVAVTSASATAQIRIDRKGLLYGNPAKSRSPAVLDLDKALAASPEGRRITEQGVQPGSARYSILRSAAMRRIRKVLREVAIELRHDCIVKKGCIRRSPVRPANVTRPVLAKLEAARIEEPPAAALRA